MSFVRCIIPKFHVNNQPLEMEEYRKTRIIGDNGDPIYIPWNKQVSLDTDSSYFDLVCDKEFAEANIAAEYICEEVDA